MASELDLWSDFSEYGTPRKADWTSREADDSGSRRVYQRVYKENNNALSKFLSKFQRWRKGLRKETCSQHGRESPVSSTQERAQELLPGIPDQVTLDKIVPQLPWIALHVLSAVSRSWNVAFRRRLVYDARVRAQGTEPLDLYIEVPHRVPFSLEKGGRFTNSRQSSRFFICSSIDKKSPGYVIPPLPEAQSRPESGLPYRCGVVSTDGKIYVIGGVVHTHCRCLHFGTRKILVATEKPPHEIWCESPGVPLGTELHFTGNGKVHYYDQHGACACDGSCPIHCPCVHSGSDKVFMLDVAAQVMKWTQCASMVVPRQFSYGGCCVKDGKIHVYGGLSLHHSDKTESEIYDPKTDSWSLTEVALTQVEWDSDKLWV